MLICTKVREWTLVMIDLQSAGIGEHLMKWDAKHSIKMYQLSVLIFQNSIRTGTKYWSDKGQRVWTMFFIDLRILHLCLSLEQPRATLTESGMKFFVFPICHLLLIIKYFCSSLHSPRWRVSNRAHFWVKTRLVLTFSHIAWWINGKCRIYQWNFIFLCAGYWESSRETVLIW